MKQRSKILAIALALALVFTQFSMLPSTSTYADGAITRIPDEIINDAKANRTPIIWFDFENVQPGDTSVTDKVSGIVATYGEQKLDNGTPRQNLSSIYTTDALTIDGAAFAPRGNKDLIMPYEPLSQTGDAASIQMWVRISEVRDWDNLFWATSAKGDRQNQQDNNIGIQPKRGDSSTGAFTFSVASRDNGGDNGASRIAAPKGTVPKICEWTLITVSQSGTETKVYLNDEEVGSGTVHYKMSELFDKIKASDNTQTMDDIKMSIGAFTDGWGDDTAHGLIDNFKIFNVALTAEEISEEYHSMDSKLDAMPDMVYDVQYSGGHGGQDVSLTRYAPSSRDWGEFVWGHWNNMSGQLYFKTFVKVTKVPGKENSTEPVGYIDYQIDGQGHQARYAMPAVKDFQDGIWQSIVVPANVEKTGRKEFRFQNRNRDDIYNIFVGPIFAIDTNDTALALPASLQAENAAYASKIASFPDYRPKVFDPATGFVYKMEGIKHDNFMENDRSYVTITPNGNYLTTKRDLKDWFTWNGYMDRLGRNTALPAGKYDFIFAYKAEGRADDKDLGNGDQNAEAPALGILQFPGLVNIRFGSEATIDGQWHVEKVTVDVGSEIPANKEFRTRNFFNGGNFRLSLGQVYIIPHTPAIALDKTAYTVGEDMIVYFSNLDAKTLTNKDISGMKIVNSDGTDLAKDYWIDFPDPFRDISIEDANGSYTYQFNVDGTNKHFFYLQPGEYKMRLQASGKEEVMSIPFTVTAASVSLDKETYNIGDPITVTYANVGKDIGGMKIVKADGSDVGEYWIDLPDPGRDATVPNDTFVYEFNKDGSSNKFLFLAPGSYKVILEKSGKVEATSANFTVQAPTIQLDKQTYNTGDSITVTYTKVGAGISGMKIVKADGSAAGEYWIDLPDPGRNAAVPDDTFVYEFNKDGAGNKFVFLAPGNYKVIIERSGKVEAAAATFTVAAPTISLNKTTYATGEAIAVTYSNIGADISGMKVVKASDNSDVGEYWIDLPDPGRNVAVPNGTFNYTFNENGTQNMFRILPPGTYKMRLQKSGGVEVMSVEFEVVDLPAISLEKTTFLPGESIKVNYFNIGDTISGMKIVKASDNSDVGEYWIDLPDPGRNVTVPSGSFTYEFNADGSSSKFVILPNGQYKVRLQKKDKSEQMSVEFTVANSENAADVIDAISDLPATIKLSDETAIKAARAAYNALSEAEKAEISEELLEKLTNAERALAALQQTTNPTEPTAPADTNDAIPAIQLLLTGAAGIIALKKKKNK